ncbi:MAG: metal-dependent hydrolase [Gammaproteobacteria bacterium]|nr:metal-dependent hydrolase [Gammaproteobacteria bacterium]
MDSVTQIVLGAAVADATAGKQFGRKAALYGAIFGTLPDLDVLVPLGDVVSDFTYHRSATHSLFMMLLVTPLFAWLLNKWQSTAVGNQFWRWFCLVYFCLSTHALLDSFTVYGTQIFWPLIDYSATWSTVFIIDPLYTLPLLIGLSVSLLRHKNNGDSGKANTIGLLISTAYLCWSGFVKLYVEHIAWNSLPIKPDPSTQVLTTPTPFNTFLWRVIVIHDNSYYDSFYSIFDGEAKPVFTPYPQSKELLTGIENSWAVERLSWFTKGFYRVDIEDNQVILSDIRMGLEPHYVFNFAVGQIGAEKITPIKPRTVTAPRDFSSISKIWDRIWDPAVTLTPNTKLSD